jgi:hypothetical protein
VGRTEDEDFIGGRRGRKGDGVARGVEGAVCKRERVSTKGGEKRKETVRLG